MAYFDYKPLHHRQSTRTMCDERTEGVNGVIVKEKIVVASDLSP